MGDPRLAEKPGWADRNLLYFFIAMTVFFAIISFCFAIHYFNENNIVSKVRAVKANLTEEKEFSDIDIQKLVGEEKHFRISRDGYWYVGGHIVGFATINGKKCFEITNNYEIENSMKKEVGCLPIFYSYFECDMFNKLIGCEYVCVKLSKFSQDGNRLFFKRKSFFHPNGYIVLAKKSFLDEREKTKEELFRLLDN